MTTESHSRARGAPLGLHVLAKPIGAQCNLACEYCFYLEKQSLYGARQSFRMSDAVLERYIRQYLAASPDPEVNFAWQGGEPTLMGLDFFQRVVELQKQHCPPERQVSNALQTNGILLDDAWCEFLRREQFLVGVSIDVETVDQVPGFLAARGIHYPIYTTEETSIPEIFSREEVLIPISFLLDDRGRVEQVFSGWTEESRTALHLLAQRGAELGAAAHRISGRTLVPAPNGKAP